MNATIEDIYEQARGLRYDEQLRLLERLAGLIRREGQAAEAPAQHSLLSLFGLGAHLWHGVDVDEYINGEREW